MLTTSATLIVCKVEEKKLWGWILQRQFDDDNLDAVTDE